MFLAALLIFVIGGSWLADKYDVGPDVDWWGQPDWFPAYWQNFENDGVPAIEPGDISVQVGAPFRGNSWDLQGTETVLLPVMYGRSNFFNGFNQFGYRGSSLFRSGGTCYQNVVNLLVISEGNPEGEPVFKHRVLLPYYLHFKNTASEAIAALVVSDDTNTNGKLDCGDNAQVEVISLIDNEVRTSDRQFIPENISQIRFDEENDSISFSEVEFTEDNVAIRSIKMSLQDFEVTETQAPDLLSKAKAAFSRTNSK